MYKQLQKYGKNILIAIVGALLFLVLQLLGLEEYLIMIGFYLGMFLSIFLYPILGFERMATLAIYIAIPITFLLYAFIFSILFNRKFLLHSTIIILLITIPLFYFISNLKNSVKNQKIAQQNAAAVQVLSEHIIYNPDSSIPYQHGTIQLKLRIKNILNAPTKGKLMFYVGTNSLGEVICSEVDSLNTGELQPGEKTELDLSCSTTASKLVGKVLPLHITYVDLNNYSHDFLSNIELR